MAIKTLWLPLAWLVATATVTVTPVLALEAPPSWTPLFGEPPTPPVPPVPPARTPAPSQDVGTPSAHPEGLPGWGVTDVTAPAGTLEGLDTAANVWGLTDVPSPSPAAPEGTLEGLDPADHGWGITDVPSPSPAAPEGTLDELDTAANDWGITDAPSPTATEGALEELDTAANGWGITDAPSPTATEGALEELDPIGTTAVPPPGTSAPPCPGDEEPPDACGEPTGEQRAAVAEALGTFALRFYQRMAEEAGPDANLLFSPITVATGLSHLLLGARGETQERLAALLAYPPGLHCVHGALQQLASTPGLFSAAQIFHNPELQLRPRFLNDSLRFYGARPYALSGNESLDLQRINAWVREASKGLLPSLLSALPPEPSLLLLSAVHLRAAWRTPLDRKKTVLLPFLRPGQRPRKVPTMTSAKYPVASFSDSRLRVQVGRLELHGGLSLVVLMPREPLEPLESLERALDPATFLALLRRAARTPPRATALSLPRLRLDLALDVVPLLHDMDFGLFLDAELCGLARGPAAVDTARHRAVLALDEAGVEAAAAMATSVARSALVLEALRPFLFVLWHNSGDFPVFMGRLSDPQP
ncbi:plasma protease C1 inhibitor [Melospiza georgiana]|uniref:plasma protease C1 inhibitor n=1 Tax=Melospiza georgiana TaxID=44398 RepID=UPI0025AC932A|nr:plasma protease C1 inhibitor [Melospiza georgiana]XP_057883223.1 plasma protease C1 inhibitor [Melospiza georgiana]